MLLFAKEGKQPEAWMALAMLAHSEKQSDLQADYIEQLKTYPHSIKSSKFFQSIPSEKAVCEALLLCNEDLIKASDDYGHVRDFITTYVKEMKLVCGLELSKEESAPDQSNPVERGV